MEYQYLSLRLSLLSSTYPSPRGEKYAMAYWWENNKIYPVLPASSDPGGEVWLEVSEPATQATLQAANGSGIQQNPYPLMG
jgi:hypothetical protein